MTLIIKKKIIKTKRLTIQPFNDKDIDDLIDLLTNEEICKTFMIPEFETKAQAISLANKLIDFSKIEDVKHLEYGIYKDDNLIGFINDCGYDDNEIEIGYVIHPKYKNNGYASEAVNAVFLELKEMGFNKVKAGYFKDNHASLRVMLKCGMKQLDYSEEITYRGNKYISYYCEIEL